MTRVIVIQPEIPLYRVGFFNRVCGRLKNDFAVYSSEGTLGVLTQRNERHIWEIRIGKTSQIFRGLLWQSGVVKIPIEKNDILVVSGAPRYLSNIALLIKGRIKGAKIIWWGHYWSSTSRSWRVKIRLLIGQLADMFLFYTDDEVDEYFDRFGSRYRPLVFSLNNGIELQPIEGLRAPFVASKRSNRLLFIGRLTEKANFQLVLHALATPICRTIEVDVIGDGISQKQLKAEADQLGIGARVHWHGSLVDETDIAVIANNCKAFLYAGSVGLSLIHAMAYGLPAIVHHDRWKHMPEIAAFSSQVGFTFKYGCSVSLSEAIAEALSDSARLDTMSQHAIAMVKQKFNTEVMAERFCKAIEQLTIQS